MSRESVRAALHEAIDAALDAEEELLLERAAPARRFGPRPARPTSLQAAESRLLELVQDVIENCSEEEARAWFAFLIDTAARNALRASSRPNEAA